MVISLLLGSYLRVLHTGTLSLQPDRDLLHDYGQLLIQAHQEFEQAIKSEQDSGTLGVNKPNEAGRPRSEQG